MVPGGRVMADPCPPDEIGRPAWSSAPPIPGRHGHPVAVDKAYVDFGAAGLALVKDEYIVLVGFQDLGFLGDDQGLRVFLGNDSHGSEDARL